MPQIPFNGEHVTQPSNPVAAIDPSDATLQGRSVARAGEALFDLGNKLDQMVKIRKTAEDKTKLDMALAIVQREATREQANQKVQQIGDDDATGFGAVDSFSSRLKEKVDTISQTLPDHLKEQFGAGAAKIDAAFADNVLVQELKKRDEVLATARAAITSVNGQTARLDPKRTLEMMKRNEIAIRESADIPEAVKGIQVREANQDILLSAVNGMKDRGDFASAEVELQKPEYAGIFGEKEREKMISDLREEHYKANGRALQEITLGEKRAEKFQKDKEKNVLAQAGVAFTQAGNSDIDRAPIKAWLRQQVDAGNLSQEKYRSIIEEKVFGEMADDRYESQIMANVIRGKTPVLNAINKVMVERGGSVSMDRANTIINKLGIYQERQRTDPNFNRLVQDGEQLLNTVLSPDLLAPLDPLTKRNREAQVRLAEGEYHRSLLANPNQNPMALADSLLKRRLNFNTSFIAPLGYNASSNELDELDPKSISEKRQKMAAQMADEVKKGTWSKKKNDQYIRQDMRLKAKGAAMTQDAASKGLDPNESAANTKGKR